MRSRLLVSGLPLRHYLLQRAQLECEQCPSGKWAKPMIRPKAIIGDVNSFESHETLPRPSGTTLAYRPQSYVVAQVSIYASAGSKYETFHSILGVRVSLMADCNVRLDVQGNVWQQPPRRLKGAG